MGNPVQPLRGSPEHSAISFYNGPISYVDVGASSGWVAEGIDKHYGIQRGILIEPQPARCSELRQRFADNRFSIHHALVIGIIPFTQVRRNV
jgi:hypothetical protein